MKIRVLVLSVVAVVLAHGARTPAVGQVPQSSIQPATVNGVVVADGGAPVKGARIRLMLIPVSAAARAAEPMNAKDAESDEAGSFGSD